MPEDCPAACASRRPARPALSARRERRHRWLRLGNLLVTGTVAVLTVGWLSGPGQDTPLGPGVAAAAPDVTSDTSWGPLTSSDRDLLVRVRLAGLWEIPTGDQAQTHAGNRRVKEVGRLLAADHRRLDEQVRQLARKLQVPLPDEPNSDQRGWMAELSELRGSDFDVAFANRLRVAHGRVFSVVSEVAGDDPEHRRPAVRGDRRGRGDAAHVAAGEHRPGRTDGGAHARPAGTARTDHDTPGGDPRGPGGDRQPRRRGPPVVELSGDMPPNPAARHRPPPWTGRLARAGPRGFAAESDLS